MEIGPEFEDDFFEVPALRKIKKATAYVPKVCKPFWFMESAAENKNPADVLLTLKHKADFHYHSKNYTKAAEEYGQCLELVPSSNNTWRREFLENLARSFLKLGDPEKALEWSLKLNETSINEDQQVISMNLLALVCHKLGKFKEELEALHSTMHVHNAVPEYWLRLGLCYAGLFKINLPEYALNIKIDDEDSESEPCCAFNLKNLKMPCAKSQESEPNLVLPAESANSSAIPSERSNFSSSLETENLIDKCDVCALGIQVVSSCLIRAKTLIKSGGTSNLSSQRDEQTIEKIDNSLQYMDVDQTFIDVASEMLGSDFLTWSKSYNSASDSQTNVMPKQSSLSSEE